MNFLKVIVFLIISAEAIACLNNRGFTGSNHYKIPINSGLASNLTKEDYNYVNDILSEIYKEKIQSEYNITFLILDHWENDIVNAYAQQMFYYWMVGVYGGIARYPGMTKDALALVTCHEIGHHIGGSPTFNIGMSVEGQSDYFGATKCIRKYINKTGHALNEENTYTSTIISTCKNQYSDSWNYEVCVRTAAAGEILGRLLAEISSSFDDTVSIDTPDLTSVNETIVDGYPNPQCRLDTFFQGSLCDADHEVDPIYGDALFGFCDQVGKRPNCWFAL